MLRRHPLAAYYLLAFAISWTLWLPRIASAQGWIEPDIPEWWHYAGAAGPVAAALIVAYLGEGRRGVAALLGQYRPSRVPVRWLAGAVGSVLALVAVGLLAHRLVEGDWPPYASLAKTANLPALGLPATILVHVLTFGIGEETGWRGFALPRLQARHTALRATLLLSAAWLAWHIPTFFENDSFQEMGAPMIAGWSIGIILGAVLLTWLYNSSGGSLAVVVAWHALFNTAAASEGGERIVAPVVTAGIMAIAILALAASGPGEMTGMSRTAGVRQQHHLS